MPKTTFSTSIREDIQVYPVKSRKDWIRFIKFPWKVYESNPFWTPPLLYEQKKFLNRRRNPFFEHADVEFFLATQSGNIVGRIAAIVNHLYNDFHQEKIGFWGLFECVNQVEVTQRLFEACRTWLSHRGMRVMRGPMNFSNNDECGLLIEDFDSRPVFSTTYNPDYYPTLISECGLKPIKQFTSYEKKIQVVSSIEDTAVSDLPVVFRHFDMTAARSEVAKIREVFNQGMADNWGFVPITVKESETLALRLESIVVPELILFAEYQNKPVGLFLAIPEINGVLQKLNGRLFPWGWFRFKQEVKKTSSVVLLAICVLPDFRGMGVGRNLFREIQKRMLNLGYDRLYVNWVWDDNSRMRRLLERERFIANRRYAIYEQIL